MSATSYADAYITEGRDAHGRWIKGYGELKSLVEGMVSSGQLDKPQGKAVIAAMVRHTSMGRGIPGLPTDHAKALEYVAKTLRHDSITLRQQTHPNIAESKRLSRVARAVETAHSVHTGVPRKNMVGTDASLLTPESTKLDGHVPGTASVLDLKPKLKAKAADAPLVPLSVAQMDGLKLVSEHQGQKMIGLHFTMAKSLIGSGHIRMEVSPGNYRHFYLTPKGEAALKDEPKVAVKAPSAPVSEAMTGTVAAQYLRHLQSADLTPELRTALKQYATGSADNVTHGTWADATLSRALRGSKPLNHSQQARVDLMDRAFSEMPPTESPIVLHRGIASNKNGGSKIGHLAVGDTIADNGYMSTTVSSKVASTFAGSTGDILHLTLPAGSHPIDINAHVKGAYGAEKEILIPRGAQIKITDIKDRVGHDLFGETHGRTITGELVLPDLPKPLQDGKPTSEPGVKAVSLDEPHEPAHEPTPTTKAVEDIRKGETVQTPDGAKTVKSIRLWGDGRVSLRWTSGDKKSTTYTPGRQLVVGNQSVTPKEMAKATVKATAKAPKVAAKAKGPKVIFSVKSPKISQKVQSVKISGENIRAGDIINQGQARIQVGGPYKRIKLERRVLSVSRADENGVSQIRVELGEPLDPRLRDPEVKPALKSKDGYYSYYQYVEQGPVTEHILAKTTVTVRRNVQVVKAMGSKVKLDEHPDVTHYHAALAAALKNGEDLAPYDPANRHMVVGQQVGHAQQLLYDMAVGQRAGVGDRTIVPDSEYARRLMDSGEYLKTHAEVSAATPYKFGHVYGFKEASPTLPGNASDEDLRRLTAAVSQDPYNPGSPNNKRAAWIQAERVRLSTATTGEQPSIYDYANSMDPEDFAHFTNESTKIQELKARRDKSIDDAMRPHVEKRIAEMRAEEGTTKLDFHIPTFDGATLEPQTWDTVQAQIDRQSTPQAKVPIGPSEMAEVIVRALNKATNTFGTGGLGPGNGTSHDRIAAVLSTHTPEDIAKYLDHPSQIPDSGGINQSYAVGSLIADLAPAHREQVKEAVRALGSTGTMISRDFTPSFYTAGMVDDGVLYHRTTPGALDPRKVEKTLAYILDGAVRVGGINPIMSPDEALQNARVFATISKFGTGDTGKADTIENTKAKIVDSKNIDDETKVKLLSAMDRIEKKMTGVGDQVTTGNVSKVANNAMVKIFDAQGATRAPDDQSPAALRAALGIGNTGSWATLATGEKLVIYDGGVPASPDDQMSMFEAQHTQRMPQWQNTQNYADDVSGDLRSQYEVMAKTFDEKLAALDAYDKVVAAMPSKDSMEHGWISQQQRDKLTAWSRAARNAIDTARNMRVDAPGNPVKRIEYVPQHQAKVPNKTISRNQRGRLSLIGYSPSEAHAKLRELGIMGNLESEIPGDAMFRGPRRSGVVTPLLPAYVRGEAQPPTAKQLISHGLTAGSKFSDLERIARSGGLMSIAERTKRGIITRTTSQIGDIASGIDHVVFATAGGGGVGGLGSSIAFVLRPDAMLRRDLLVSPTDYGGGKDRYAKYKKYRDEIEAQAGMEVGKTDLFTPLDPRARQVQLKEGIGGGDEWDVGGLVSMDDVQAVSLQDETLIPQVKALFADLKAQGLIARIPDVVPKSQALAIAKGQASNSTTHHEPYNPGDEITYQAYPGSPEYTSKVKNVIGALSSNPSYQTMSGSVIEHNKVIHKNS